MFGYDSPGHLLFEIGDSAQALYAAPEHRTEFLGQLKQAKSSCMQEIIFQRRDRSVFHGKITAWSVTNEQGYPCLLEGFIEDMTPFVEARSALEQNKGRIAITLEQRDIETHGGPGLLPLKPGPYVFLKISDNGTGIPETLRSKIFDPFYTTKAKGKGTGLGLAQVKRILFGHVKGAFTGADVSRSGLISLAHEGTLFLDEIGELPLDHQKLFLRVLQERNFRPVGSTKEHSSRFKLLAATNRKLKDMVAKGEFRDDLYFRLKSFVIEIPPLREHMEDLKGLVQYHLSRVCESEGRSIKGISEEVFDLLSSYPWPGNIRELFQILESALAVAGEEPMLYPEHLPLEIRALAARKSLEKKVPQTPSDSDPHQSCDQISDWKSYRSQVLAKAEKSYLRDLMAMSNGRSKTACQLSGLSRTRLYIMLKSHEMK